MAKSKLAENFHWLRKLCKELRCLMLKYVKISDYEKELARIQQGTCKKGEILINIMLYGGRGTRKKNGQTAPLSKRLNKTTIQTDGRTCKKAFGCTWYKSASYFACLHIP